MQDQWENYVVSLYGLECTLPEGSCNSVSLDQQRYSSADQQTGMEMGAHLRLRSTKHIGLIVPPQATALIHYDNVSATYKKKEGITFSITYYLASHHHDRW
jgi:hypothetical protein